jgi:hypothetical protein
MPRIKNLCIDIRHRFAALVASRTGARDHVWAGEVQGHPASCPTPAQSERVDADASSRGNAMHAPLRNLVA